MTRIRDKPNWWRTINEHVDGNTGEDLKNKNLTNYILINKEKKIDYDNKNIRITRIYKHSGQLDLFE